MPLRLDDVGYTYAENTRYAHLALAQVSLQVSPGELVLVVGATGSGKSTLLRLAAGLMSPGAGSVSIDDVPLTRETARGSVGLVFQDAESQLFADTVLDDVAFGPRNLGASATDAESVARESMEAVGLAAAEYAERSPFALSGGEARRAAIAGVLAMRPAYVLADEPTSGLDANGRQAVRDLLAQARRAAGIVIVSHAAEEFLGTANRVLVLRDGRTSWYGTASRLVSDPGPLLDAGLVPPDVLEVQRLAAQHGLELGAFTLDPAAAARALLAAGGRV